MGNARSGRARGASQGRRRAAVGAVAVAVAAALGLGIVAAWAGPTSGATPAPAGPGVSAPEDAPAPPAPRRTDAVPAEVPTTGEADAGAHEVVGPMGDDEGGEGPGDVDAPLLQVTAGVGAVGVSVGTRCVGVQLAADVVGCDPPLRPDITLGVDTILLPGA